MNSSNKSEENNNNAHHYTMVHAHQGQRQYPSLVYNDIFYAVYLARKGIYYVISTQMYKYFDQKINI